MDIDLVTRGKSTSLTYIFLDPSFKGDYTLVDFATLYCDSEIKTFEQEVVLCQALEDLPCCASDEAGVQTAPLNVVSIAELEEAGATFLRRDYRYTDLSARYVFGRPQDTSGQKWSQWSAAQPHVARSSLTTIRYRGKPVWLAQVSSPLGGRLREQTDKETESLIDPDVDEARNDLVEDMIYS